MIKKLFIPVLILTIGIYAAGCKKCYTCQNSCMQCTATYSGHVFSHVLCRDSFGTDAQYYAAMAADTNIGYTCVTGPSTYIYNFCSNKPGETTYPSYFDHGGRAPCTAK